MAGPQHTQPSLEQQNEIMERYHSIVIRALRGDNMILSQLINVMAGPPSQDSEAVLACLASLTSMLQPGKHDRLVNAVLSFDLVPCLHMVDSFERFTVNLATSNSAWLVPTFRALVIKFKGVVQPNEAGEIDMNVVSQLERSMHNVLHRIVFMFPSGAQNLLDVIASTFPHMREDVSVQVNFIRNSLQVFRSAKMLRPGILALITDKLLRIDVEIKLEDVPDDDDFVFELELGSSSPNPGRELANKLDSMMLLMFDFLADFGADDRNSEELMDQLLVLFQKALLLTYKSKYIQFLLFVMCEGKESHQQKFLQRLIHLLTDESQTIHIRLACAGYIGSYVARALYLPTAATKAALQFLAQWLTQYVEAHDPTTTPTPTPTTTPTTTTATAATTTTSSSSSSSNGAPSPRRAARAGRATTTTTTTTTTATAAAAAAVHTSSFSSSLLQRGGCGGGGGGGGGGGSPSHPSPRAIGARRDAHILFYATCQAFVYILCYRLPDLMTSKSTRGFLLSLQMEKFLFCSFRPLLLVLPHVAEEFIRLMNVWHLVDCTGALDTGKNKKAPTPLDSFFPFDPYLLLHSSRYVKPLYRQWQGHHDDEERQRGSGSESDDDDSSSDDEGEEVDENGLRAVRRVTSMSSCASSVGTDVSVAAMSCGSHTNYEGMEGLMRFTPPSPPFAMPHGMPRNSLDDY